MKNLAAVLALLVAASPLAAQDRAIDLPRRPDPAVALSRSLVIPGAGWFYLGRHSKKAGDAVTGLAHLAMTIGGVALMVNGAKKHKRGTFNFGLGLAFGSRLLDVWGVTDTAVKRRDAP